MSSPENVGSIAWADLTVADAGALKDFYREVVGFRLPKVEAP